MEDAENSAMLSAFDGLWPEMPTPFCKGDILVVTGQPISESTPFVLDRIPYWNENDEDTRTIELLRKCGDYADLVTDIYGLDGDGSIWHGHGPSYLELDYCRSELRGTERILTALSNYLKGEISLDILLGAYDILRTEQRLEQDRAMLDIFTPEYLEKAGLVNAEGPDMQVNK